MTTQKWSTGIKKHPYVYAAVLWLYLFFAFGYFDIDRVVTVSFIVPILISGALVYIYYSKKEKIRRIPEKKRRAPLLALGAVIYSLLTVYVFSIAPTDDFIKSRNSFVPLAFLLAALIAWCIYLSVRKKWSVNKILLCVFLLSTLIHLYFMLTGKFNISQQDMGYIGENGVGHFGYISQLYDHLLPAQFDPRERWQFYHPPLFHYSAVIMFKIMGLFGIKFQIALSNIQFLNMLYVMIAGVCFYRIALLLRLRKLPLILSFSVFCFAPALDYITLIANNDMMAFMFTLLCIYHTIVWYRDRRVKNILKIALCFGLGMLTKMSVALTALPIAVVFLYALFCELRKKEFKTLRRLIGQMFAFLGLAAPLSLYWSLRNLIRFGVPLGYVPLSQDEGIYLLEPAAKRLFDFFNPDQYTNPFINIFTVDSFNEYNPLIALIKTSSTDLGVERQRIGTFLGFAVVLLTAAVAFIAFAFMIYILVRKKTIPGLAKVFFALMYSVYFISYIIFCIRYPHICTEHIRYAIPLIMIGALFIGFGIRKLMKKKSPAVRTLVWAVSLTVLAFCLCSAAVIFKTGTLITIDWLMQ